MYTNLIKYNITKFDWNSLKSMVITDSMLIYPKP